MERATSRMPERRDEAIETSRAPNVGPVGRWGSLAAGGILGSLGLVWLGSGRVVRGLLAGIAGAALIQRGATGQCAVYGALGIDTAGTDGSSSLLPEASLELARSITVHTPIEEVRELCRDAARLARFVPGVAGARSEGEHRVLVSTRSGRAVAVDVEREGEDRIRFWGKGTALEIEEGVLELTEAPGDRGTEVAVELTVRLPGGRIGAAIGRVLRDLPAVGILGEALYRLRAHLDAGEIPVSDDTSARHARSGERPTRLEEARPS